MTRLLLIRHGSTQAVGHQLTGRTAGVHLDDVGKLQAQRLAARLADLRLSAVCSSPIERAVETAQPMAQRQGLQLQIRPGLTELDFGDWTGLSFEELDPVARWRQFNSVRSCTRIPGGEHIAEVQARVVRELESIRADHAQGTVAIVSHADVIRTALAYYAAVPIDLFLRLEISIASVTIVNLTDDGPTIVCVNHTESLPR